MYKRRSLFFAFPAVDLSQPLAGKRISGWTQAVVGGKEGRINTVSDRTLSVMRLALYQPDIPQNLGAAIRLCAALEVPLDVIEPCGFPLSDKAIKRAAMDYGDCAKVSHHTGWDAFRLFMREELGPKTRLILFTTRGAQPHTGFSFQPDDVLLMGRESAGVPDEVHAAADERIFIPISAQARSINVITAASIGLGEALRQCSAFPVRA